MGRKSKGSSIQKAPKEEGTTAEQFLHQTRDVRQKHEHYANNTRLEILPLKGTVRRHIPLTCKQRVKVGVTRPGDSEIVPASYYHAAADEYYVFYQAPAKDNYHDLYRLVWQDGVKLIVAVVEKGLLSETDPDKCFPYWPLDSKKELSVQEGRFVVKYTSKSSHSGFTIYELKLTSTEKVDDAEDSGPRTLSLIHVDNWVRGRGMPVDDAAALIKALVGIEDKIMRDAKDEYYPPTILQGWDGTGRVCAITTLIALKRQLEARGNFDVEHYARKVAMARPGALVERAAFFMIFAVAFRLAQQAIVLTKDDADEVVQAMNALIDKSHTE